MSFREHLQAIALGYLSAKAEPFGEHPMGIRIRQHLPNSAKALIGLERASAYIVKGSAGQGNWSNSPWLAILDPVVTSSAEGGYYPVYLFSDDFSQVSLVLGQGTYDVRREFKSKGPDVLEMRAALLRTRVPEFKQRFQVGPFPIRESNHGGGDWSTASAWGRTYQVSALPENDVLAADLSAMLTLYHLATSRGGTDLVDDAVQDSKHKDDAAELEGARRKRLHEKVERQRNGQLAKKAKSIHGTKCQACGFDFTTVYGEVGLDFIEAHHLTPLHRLAKDGPVMVNPRLDFAVLCSNCHRMIHKLSCPPLSEFREFVSKAFVESMKALKATK